MHIIAIFLYSVLHCFYNPGTLLLLYILIINILSLFLLFLMRLRDYRSLHLNNIHM